MLLLPWHIRDRMDGLEADLPGSAVRIEAQPADSGSLWGDLVPLYLPLRDAVRNAGRPAVVLSGDCISALAVLAGAQAAGLDPSLVWIDAHGDFHTESSTISGYLGGLPLAKAVGRGDMTLPDGLGLTPLAEHRVVLSDGRDLDPPEVTALAESSVRRIPLDDLVHALPDGIVHLHVDLDIIDPGRLPGLRFPAPGGAGFGQLAATISRIAGLRPLAALSIAATWDPERSSGAARAKAIAAVLEGAALP